MKALTNVQRKILTAASKQPKLPIEEHMGRMKGSAARQVAYSLLCSGYVIEDGDNHYITDEGVAALSAKKAKPAKAEKKGKQKPAKEAKAKKPAAKGKKVSKKAKAADTEAVTPTEGDKPAKGRQLLINMMSREEGATGQQMVDATGWQKGAVFGTLSKIRKLLATSNQVIASDKDDSGKLVYKIA
ncbi:MAG: DUF3489 domain-containing protein [Pseudomonadota bacterium]|nr:DUF3489 domain-containing protein [Pseudomonadota bacterium]MDE3038706.1 DUF3489 domain-containing protein [Pseudomonadota bacterium]